MVLSTCCSAEIVLTALLLEQIELLERLQSVDRKDKFTVLRHTETSHGILKLNVIEDDSGDVVGILLSKGLVRSGLDLGDQLVGIVLNRSADLGAEISSVVVSLSLGVAHTERHIGVDCLEISLDRSEKSSLWVLLHLGSFLSSGLVGSDISILDGVGSHIGESRDELVSVVVVVSSGKESSLSWSQEESNCKGRKIGRAHV